MCVHVCVREISQYRQDYFHISLAKEFHIKEKKKAFILGHQGVEEHWVEAPRIAFRGHR